MSGDSELKLGEVIIEGKTKVVHQLADEPDKVLLQSKDRITAGNNARSHDMQGKAAISTATTSLVFGLLADAGVFTKLSPTCPNYLYHEGARKHFVSNKPEYDPTKQGVRSHFVRQHGESGFIARRCEMVPIEWVTRRVATGSFLKRNPGVKEGYRFTPPKLETFYKDDEANDPQWSVEQILAARFKCGGVVIGATEANIMARMTITVFEILEKAWASVDCSLIDMKIEFGIDTTTGEVLLADVIDSDSWRLWPSGDRRLMKDKQVYRELTDVTSEALLEVKRNFTWVLDKLKMLLRPPHARVVVIMGSPSDSETAQVVRTTLSNLGVPCKLRVTSAHKGTEETLRILAEYEGDGVPTVFIAIAGRSNGLGPVLAGNTVSPVINCPPLKADWAAQDIWSSLRLPSGLGCSTVLSAEGAALQAAQIVALSDHVIWSRLRAAQLNTWIKLTQADHKISGDNS